MFKVFASSTPIERSRKVTGSFVVTDKPDDFDDSDIAWPAAAHFIVSMRHDEMTQLRRAREYADYLNRGIIDQPPI